MIRKSFLKTPLKSDEMALQITSMADIFIIILVFLLKSYATGTVNLNPGQGVTLPQARIGPSEATLDALRVEITSTGVQIEGAPVLALSDYRMETKHTKGAVVSESLSRSFAKERERQLLIAKNNSEVKLDSRVVVMADQKTPYETVKQVLASAALQGYTDFKLAVVRGDQ